MQSRKLFCLRTNFPMFNVAILIVEGFSFVYTTFWRLMLYNFYCCVIVAVSRFIALDTELYCCVYYNIKSVVYFYYDRLKELNSFLLQKLQFRCSFFSAIIPKKTLKNCVTIYLFVLYCIKIMLKLLLFTFLTDIFVVLLQWQVLSYMESKFARSNFICIV